MTEYNDHIEYDIPMAGGEMPQIATEGFDPAIYDEAFGEWPAGLENLVRKD